MLRSLIRCAGLLAVALIGLAIIALIAPQQLSVTLYKGTVVVLGGFLGYWIDRHVFPYARPHEFISGGYPASRFNLATIRRAIIVAATIIAVALAL